MAEEAARTRNPNFVRPDDPQRAVQNKNFVSREAVEIRSREVEATSGVAVRRPGESEGAYAKRSGVMAKDRKDARVRSQMSPQIARRELAQLEQKWAGKVPTKEDAERFASEFDYMNDCRVAIGWPEVDYTKAREPEKNRGEVQGRFIELKKRSESDRKNLCTVSTDFELMRMVAIHDVSESVREVAERKFQELWAKQSAS